MLNPKKQHNYGSKKEVFHGLPSGGKNVSRSRRGLGQAEDRDDPNSVMVCYNDQENDEQVCLGYIPRSQNNTIALMMDMGYSNIFECRINQIDERAHPEQQVHLVVKIKRNMDV